MWKDVFYHMHFCDFNVIALGRGSALNTFWVTFYFFFQGNKFKAHPKIISGALFCFYFVFLRPFVTGTETDWRAVPPVLCLHLGFGGTPQTRPLD